MAEALETKVFNAARVLGRGWREGHRRRVVAALCCAVLAFGGAVPVAESAVEKSTYYTRNGRYKWYVCEGHAPEDAGCTMKVKVAKAVMTSTQLSYRADGLSETTGAPDWVAAFAGRIESEWVGRESTWRSETTGVGASGGYYADSTFGPDFIKGETITMTVKATGYGWWKVGTRVRLK
ncbi:MAG TPA: hypothetical protein VGB83_01405 [Actinomycetota bacterium]